jgi:hypothetical protein
MPSSSLTDGYLSIVFRGGPANQIVQYHTATYLAKKWNKQFVVDPNKLKLSKKHRHDSEFDIRKYFDCTTHIVGEYNTQISQRDPQGAFDPSWKKRMMEMPPPKGNVVLHGGSFQTFWDDHITIPKLPITTVPFESEKTVFIHVRRGDYIGSILDIGLINYFNKAYRLMREQKPDALFVVASDDIDWCKNNLLYINNVLFLEDYTYQQTLFLMSKCRQGAILSNSTFGLLGAYLSQQNDPSENMVFYVPYKWCTLNRGVENSVYPDWCQKLTYEQDEM